MSSMILLDEFQSRGTVQLVPEVRKMTTASACTRGGNEKNASQHAAIESSRSAQRERWKEGRDAAVGICWNYSALRRGTLQVPTKRVPSIVISSIMRTGAKTRSWALRYMIARSAVCIGVGGDNRQDQKEQNVQKRTFFGTACFSTTSP